MHVLAEFKGLLAIGDSSYFHIVVDENLLTDLQANKIIINH